MSRHVSDAELAAGVEEIMANLPGSWEEVGRGFGVHKCPVPRSENLVLTIETWSDGFSWWIVTITRSTDGTDDVNDEVAGNDDAHGCVTAQDVVAAVKAFTASQPCGVW